MHIQRIISRAGTEGSTVSSLICNRWLMLGLEIIIIILIKNKCHSNITVDRLQGCGHRKKLRESRLTGAVSVIRMLKQFSFQALSISWCLNH